MRFEHTQFIDSAESDQLHKVRDDLEALLPLLRESHVIKQTKALMAAIDQELLERVMRQLRLSQPVKVEPALAQVA